MPTPSTRRLQPGNQVIRNGIPYEVMLVFRNRTWVQLRNPYTLARHSVPMTALEGGNAR